MQQKEIKEKSVYSWRNRFK